jgi:hypothetical protein
VSRLKSLGVALAVGALAYRLARKLDVDELTARARGDGEAAG